MEMTNKISALHKHPNQIIVSICVKLMKIETVQYKLKRQTLAGTVFSGKDKAGSFE